MIFWSYERLATPKNDCDDFVTKGDYSEPMARLVLDPTVVTRSLWKDRAKSLLSTPAKRFVTISLQ